MQYSIYFLLVDWARGLNNPKGRLNVNLDKEVTTRYVLPKIRPQFLTPTSWIALVTAPRLSNLSTMT